MVSLEVITSVAPDASATNTSKSDESKLGA
jgi:hypothetical protein